jgi:hypothetical protein
VWRCAAPPARGRAGGRSPADRDRAGTSCAPRRPQRPPRRRRPAPVGTASAAQVPRARPGRRPGTAPSRGPRRWRARAADQPRPTVADRGRRRPGRGSGGRGPVAPAEPAAVLERSAPGRHRRGSRITARCSSTGIGNAGLAVQFSASGSPSVSGSAASARARRTSGRARPRRMTRSLPHSTWRSSQAGWLRPRRLPGPNVTGARAAVPAACRSVVGRPAGGRR